MIIKARINGEGGKEYRLCLWNAAEFASDATLRLQTDDLKDVKETFEHITKIEIYVSDNLVAAYTKYDGYGSISYAGKVFVQHENIFADCMAVSLTRSSLVDEVERLNDVVNPTIDIESMTTEEYRTYLLKQVGSACRREIYEGTQIQLMDGSVEYFTYDDDDQRNLTNAMAILIIAPELPYIPYHPSGGFCRMIPAFDLLTIYSTLQLKLTYLTTRCNFMNMWIRGVETKEELLQINWDTELPADYQAQVNEIYTQALGIVNKIKEKFVPAEQEPESEGSEGSAEEGEPDESESTEEA